MTESQRIAEAAGTIFNAGDLVVCVDDSIVSAKPIRRGAIYTVRTCALYHNYDGQRAIGVTLENIINETIRMWHGRMEEIAYPASSFRAVIGNPGLFGVEP